MALTIAVRVMGNDCGTASPAVEPGTSRACCAAPPRSAPHQENSTKKIVSALAFSACIAAADGAILYVEDHGKPLATQGMTGKLLVLNGLEKSEAELKPAGDNKLQAKGVKLEQGTQAVASLTTAAKKAITVRFTVRK